MPTKLHYGQSTAIGELSCRRHLSFSQSSMLHRTNACTFVIRGDPQSGACDGDAGSPVITTFGTVFGIVSWGIHCGQNFADVHTRVDLYLDFIQAVSGLAPPSRN